MIGNGYWQDLTSAQFGSLDKERTVVVLPVSAIEQHGPHLPLGTDALINQAIIEGTLALPASSSTVLILPPLVVGDSLEHQHFPGTLSIDSETLLGAWVNIGESVARAGLSKLILFNSHGGNVPLVDIAALRLRVDRQLLVVRANYFSFRTPAGLFETDELAHGFSWW